MPFNRLNHSILGEIRPRFYLRIQNEPTEAMDHIEKQVKTVKTVTCDRSNHLIFLKTPSWLAHYWSPEMTVRIEKSEYSDAITVCCLLGPRQAVWAMFTLIYAAIILITTFGGMFGFVQYQRDGFSWFLWLIPMGIIAFFSVFLVAKIGQKKGRDQMLYLVSFLYHSLAEIGPVERVERR